MYINVMYALCMHSSTQLVVVLSSSTDWFTIKSKTQ